MFEYKTVNITLAAAQVQLAGLALRPSNRMDGLPTATDPTATPGSLSGATASRELASGNSRRDHTPTTTTTSRT